MLLIIEGNKSGRLSWWINAAYVVHLDMKIHPGGMMLIGEGDMQRKASEQKISIWRPTKFNIVVVDNQISGIIWRIKLLGSQG